MCFRSNDTQSYVATKDIVCYKEVLNVSEFGCTSYWTEFKYEFGRKYTLADCNYDVIDSDYHETMSDCESREKNLLVPEMRGTHVEINTGYHSFRRPRGIYAPIVRCIIPKGSTYYMSESEYVSNEIIINGRL